MTLPHGTLDDTPGEGWTIREIVAHGADVPYYAKAMGRL